LTSEAPSPPRLRPAEAWPAFEKPPARAWAGARQHFRNRAGRSTGKLKGLRGGPILADDTFDVFLSHNSKDKPVVRQIAEALRGRGLRVWLDEWELVPGRPWQEAVEDIIASVRSSAVLVGPDGLGPWEIPEMRACLSQLVRRKLPVIPVLLPDCPNPPELPLFLGEVTWVDLRGRITEEGLDRLEWGITGRKPNRERKEQGSSAPRFHNLPFLPLGDLLKGRDEELQRLITNLQSSTKTASLAIHGLGGIGKTRLAVEYAWRSGDRYDTALFVVADSPEALRSGLASLARPGLLNLPEYEAGAEAKAVEAVLSWLRDNSRWLLILDNIDTEEAAKAVREMLPRLGNGHVLITSRRREWPRTIQKQPLGELNREEAVQFLLKSTEGERTHASDDAEQAGRLAEILGGLPLALEQAAAYIVHHQMTFADYLEDWQRERQKVLEWHDEAVLDYPASVAATWQKTFNQLCPEGATILRLTAFLAPEPIPEEMFEEGKDTVEEAATTFIEETGQQRTERTIRDAFSDLAGFSMITRSAGRFTVHRVVQEVLRTRIPVDSQRSWIDFSLRLVNDYSPQEPSDVRTWPVWDVLRPHAARIVEEADRVGIPDPTARLMSQLALLLLEKSLYIQAEPLMRRALAISEASLGPDHPGVSIRLNNLALLLQDTNRLTEAEPLIRRALAIDEASFGTDHPEVAIDLNNLAQLLQATNRLAEAEPLMRALDTDEASFGTDHPNVAIGLNNLTQLLKATNRLAEAEPLMRRALEIDEASFGTDHPNVAIRLNNLAQLLQDTNRLAEAEPLMRRALEVDEDSFGTDHPNVARDLNNLAQLLQDTNRLTEAEPLMRRALAIFERSLGPDHPRTQIARKNLEILIAKMRPDEPA
jgi:tetratricopeptide (TPR) repeat protein